MANTGPKRHHYVTASYLAAFATPPTRGGRLWQADKQSGRVYPATPDNAAVEGYYYRVDIDGVDPNLLEYEFGKIENEALPIIRKAVEDHALPAGRPLDVIIGFVGLHFVRGPKFRRKYNEALTSLTRATLAVTGDSEEVFRNEKARRIEDGHDVEEVTIDDIREWVRDIDAQDVRIQMDRTTLTKSQFESAPRIADVLRHRNWGIRVLHHETPDLVTSDNPVVLRRVAWPRVGSRRLPLALGYPSAEVLFPLTPRALLVGRLGGPVPRRRIRAQEGRLINQLVADNCERFLYSRVQDPVLGVDTGSYGRGE
jgi:hypothetical protein